MISRLFLTLICSLVIAASASAQTDEPLISGLKIEHRMVDSAGVNIHVATAGEGPLVVLIHGFPDFWYTWRFQMPELVKAGYQVVAIDQRGYNSSDKPEKLEDYALSKLVDDVVAVVKHFQAEKAIIVGHDWGGLVAWSFAMNYPDKLDRLIILNLPHPRGLFRELASNPDQQKASAYARTFQQPGTAKVLMTDNLAGWVKDPQDREIYKKALKRSSVEGMLNYYKVNYPRTPYEDLKIPDFPQVKSPVLQIHGLDDVALVAAGLNDTWKWIDAEFTLVTIPKVGHFVQQDAAELVTKTMIHWLKK